MTNDFKCKIIDRWFDKHKETWDVFCVRYEGVLLSWYHNSKRILIYWMDTYQMLTITDMFSGALTRTFYKDTRQVDELIHLITENNIERNNKKKIDLYEI